MTSFVRRGQNSVVPIAKGQKYSPNLSCNVTTTGIATLDYHLGGGIPLSSFVILRSDALPGQVSNSIARAFALNSGEGQYNVLLVDNPSSATVFRPKATSETESKNTNSSKSSNLHDDLPEKLDIAWRYADRPIVENELIKVAGTISVTPAMIDLHIKARDIPQDDCLSSFLLEKLISIRKEIGVQTIIRISLVDLHFITWGLTDEKLIHFLQDIRKILAKPEIMPAVGLCLLSSSLIGKPADTFDIRCSDIVIEVTSFDAENDPELTSNPVYKGYIGILNLVRLSRPLESTALTPWTPPATLLGMKVNKKMANKESALLVEPLYLPPDLSETASRTQNSACTIPRGGSGDGGDLF